MGSGGRSRYRGLRWREGRRVGEVVEEAGEGEAGEEKRRGVGRGRRGEGVRGEMSGN